MIGQIVIRRLAMGAIYALIALGYAFVWKTMAIVNFAAGEFVTFSTYIFVVTFITALGFPFLVAALSAAVVMRSSVRCFPASSSRGCRPSGRWSRSSRWSASASS